MLTALSCSALAAAEPSLRVATWQGDRAGAFAFTFDDGQREQAEVAAPMLEAVGLSATFVINPGRIDHDPERWCASWDQWRALAARGHEIGNHAMTHRNLTDAAVTPEILETEIVAAKARIEAELGRPCLTFCYPYNAENDAARAVVARVHAVATDGARRAYGGKDFTAAAANAWIDEAIARGTFVVAMIHGIDTGYMPFPSRAVLQEHLAYAAAKRDQVWIAPFGVIRRYQLEREGALLAGECGAGRATFRLACTLDASAFDVPLTVVVPSGPATTASATREDGTALPCAVVGEVIHCAVAPGPGAVTVTWR